MELFTHDMQLDLFRSTNETWNQLRLNSKWSVGTVTELIQQRSFNSKEDWMNYYYESGKERLEKIAQLPIYEQQKLLNPKMGRYLSEELKSLNTQFGRTREELDEKGTQLYLEMVKQNPSITLDLCQQAVHYRVIGETWNGVIIREKLTIESLEKQLETMGVLSGQWIKTPGEMDYQYEVDYELFLNQKRTLGIQIKPDSYRGYTPYLEQAKRINLYKNQQYYETYRTPVLYVYANSRGKISNLSEVEQTLKQCLGC